MYGISLLFMHYLDMHTVAIYATRLTFKHFRENVFNQVFNQHRVSNLKYKGKVKLNHIITIDHTHTHTIK